MAGIRQTFGVTIRDDAGRSVATESAVIVGDAVEEFNVTCPGSSNITVPITVDVSTVVGFWIVSTGDVTMTENDDGTPDLTQALTANTPYWWYTGKGSNPFSIDITSLKFTKATATDCIVKGGFLTS